MPYQATVILGAKVSVCCEACGHEYGYEKEFKVVGTHNDEPGKDTRSFKHLNPTEQRAGIGTGGRIYPGGGNKHSRERSR